MTEYTNAIRNAEEYTDVPAFPPNYKAQEIEVFFGDSPIDSTYHYKHGEMVGLDPENIGNEPVVQILIDDQWAYIQAGNTILLDRLGEIELPQTPSKEHLVTKITQMLQV